MRELQTLGLVNRHHFHCVALLAVVGIGIEGDVLEIVREADFQAIMRLLVEAHRLYKLVDVLQAVLVLILTVELFQSVLFQEEVHEVRDA